MSTGIEWTAETWNPLAAFDRETGERGWFCTKVSPGCANCYAEGLNKRLGTGHAYAVPNLDEIEFRLVNLDRPLQWQRSGHHVRVFVNSMTDLFHEEVTDGMLDRMFAAMAMAPDLTFQVLTKRPDRMREYVSDTSQVRRDGRGGAVMDMGGMTDGLRWPLPNVWLGTSVEDQEAANERVPELLDTPAAVRFLSCEPLIDRVSFRWAPWVSVDGSSINHLDGLRPLDWVIVGGESGPQAREMELDWAREIVDQCQRAGVPVFVKQLGSAWAGSSRSKGGDPDTWPEDLRVREFPDEALQGVEETQGELAL